MRGCFVTGTDTSVGKTLLCAALLAAAPAGVHYAKPVQTGSPPDDDRATLLELAGVAAARVPDLGLKLPVPVSPHHAAQLAGVRLEAAALAARVTAWRPAPQAWLVEGAGGLLAPLNARETALDLARALGLPVLVAVRVRLGAINHTLLTLRALEQAGLACAGVVLVGDDDPSLASALAAHAPGRVLGRLPWLEPVTPAAVQAAGRALCAGSPALAAALAGGPP
ncbi:MAG: dethiobiotin synthase [Planctomycetia bacterium]